MDTSTVAFLIGTIVPFPLALIRRFVDLDEKGAYAVTFMVCFGVMLALRLNESAWDWKLVIKDLSGVVAGSQIVYATIKQMGVIDRIENAE